MNRTITVKGTGSVSLKPDLTVLSMTLRSLDPDYDKSMTCASEQIAHLRDALCAVGFNKKSLKTVGFNVVAEHESVRDERGTYRSVFKGFACIHQLKLEFSFNTEKLSKTLSAIAGCVADPELSIHFTVRNTAAACDALLTNASENARHKAEVIAAASGVKLGELVSIDYAWNEQNVRSRTEFAMDAKCMALGSNARMDIEPENINLSDTAIFVWEIV